MGVGDFSLVVSLEVRAEEEVVEGRRQRGGWRVRKWRRQ